MFATELADTFYLGLNRFLDWLHGGRAQEGRCQIWDAENELRKQYPELSMENRLSGTEEGQMAIKLALLPLLVPMFSLCQWAKGFTLSKDGIRCCSRRCLLDVFPGRL